jgi:hypothetical protein
MDNDIPPKTVCDFCAFMLTEDQSTEATAARLIESKYRTIREVQNAPKKARHLSVGGLDDRTETCFIDSPMWAKRAENIHCPDRIDKVLSLETALDLREARVTNLIARSAKIWAIIAAIIATIAIAMPIVLEWLSKN